jgi:hypothetical protein
MKKGAPVSAPFFASVVHSVVHFVYINSLAGALPAAPVITGGRRRRNDLRLHRSRDLRHRWNGSLRRSAHSRGCHRWNHHENRRNSESRCARHCSRGNQALSRHTETARSAAAYRVADARRRSFQHCLPAVRSQVQCGSSNCRCCPARPPRRKSLPIRPATLRYCCAKAA